MNRRCDSYYALTTCTHIHDVRYENNINRNKSTAHTVVKEIQKGFAKRTVVNCDGLYWNVNESQVELLVSMYSVYLFIDINP